MGCPSSAVIGNTLTFSITTHDPETGILTDTASPPRYRVYKDENPIPLLSGFMAKLDDANTTGFYTEEIECSEANGFEVGKSYTVYIEATVVGNTGGIAYSFNVDPTAEEEVDAYLDRSDAIELGISLREAHRLELAAMAGKLSGAETRTVHIKNAVRTEGDPEKDRIVSDVDRYGNRLNVVIDPT
jgi:hypothetical protein